MREKALALLVQREPSETARMQDADTANAVHTAAGRALITAWHARTSEAAADVDTSIPDHLAHAAIATQPTHWWGDGHDFENMRMLVCALPWLARAPLTELYLPRQWAERLHPELNLESVERVFVSCAEMHGYKRPKTVVRTAPKVARNEACACGSGKKAKRCCKGQVAPKDAADVVD